MNKIFIKIIAGISSLAILSVGVFVFSAENITTFNECAEKFEIIESYPRVCFNQSNERFVEDIGTLLEKEDLIRISGLDPHKKVTNPIIIEGEARKEWFFDGTFPLRVESSDGRILGVSDAQALDEAINGDFIRFKAILHFTKGKTNSGNLILEKNNQTGDPEKNDELRMPILI